jgi:flagellar motor switch/type III secretory pathway protein FliN
MATWTTDIAPRIADAFCGAADRLSEALQAAFDTAYKVQVGDPQTVERWQDDVSGAGILLTLSREDEAMLAVLPESVTKLAVGEESVVAETLAALGAAFQGIFPEEFAATSVAVKQVADLSAELTALVSDTPLTMIAIALESESRKDSLRLVWPAGIPMRKSTDDETLLGDSSEEDVHEDASATTDGQAADGLPQYATLQDGIRLLPPYARSLLKISLPIKVTLAETKLQLSEVLGLGPGSIIQFKKSCEDTLTLEAGEQKIAQGEAVKVGDKFGLWITSIARPAERFYEQRREGSERRIK